MRVILARRRGAARAAGEFAPVHAYRVPDDPSSVEVWQAVCGVELKPGEAEEIPRFTGAPCSICLLAALGEDPAGSPSTSTSEEQRSRVGTYPAMQPIAPSGCWAVALWGDREAHLVGAERSPRTAGRARRRPQSVRSPRMGAAGLSSAGLAGMWRML